MAQEQLLDIYTDYLISQNKYATATGLEALLEGEVSHDKISRFLRESDLGSKDLWTHLTQKKSFAVNFSVPQMPFDLL